MPSSKGSSTNELTVHTMSDKCQCFLKILKHPAVLLWVHHDTSLETLRPSWEILSVSEYFTVKGQEETQEQVIAAPQGLSCMRRQEQEHCGKLDQNVGLSNIWRPSAFFIFSSRIFYPKRIDEKSIGSKKETGANIHTILWSFNNIWVPCVVKDMSCHRTTKRIQGVSVVSQQVKNPTWCPSGCGFDPGPRSVG